MKIIYRTVFIGLLLFLSSQGICAKSDLEIIRQRFIAELIEPEINEVRVLDLMKTIKEDGIWPNINYQDISRTGFQHGEHLGNLVDLSRAYKKKGSKLKGDRQLKKTIDAAINYWTANDFICENWWWNQIGTPDALIKVLLIMDKDLSNEQVDKILPMVGRANLNATGARPSGDRIKIAGLLAKTLLFKRDEVQFNEVVKVIEGEIKFATGRGMQYDFSFHHREDKVNNTLSYGTGYADAFADWAANVSGTKYQFSNQSLKLLIDYYLDGICKMMIYGKIPDPGAMNRDITRINDIKAFGTSTPENLLKASDYRKDVLEEIVKIRKDEAKATLSHCTFYWQSDHLSVQRPSYFTSVRMFSSRNYNMEEPYNGEGLMNHHRGDGSNYISLTGKEYYNISAVYDWQKIPGTTVLQKPSLPPENEIQKKGLTDFVGAVTDGKYGAAAFDFKSPHDLLEAKKAWFFFDEEYVCLGVGINSKTKNRVATTLNQCLLNGDVVVMTDNQKSVLKQGDRQLNKVKWVYHDGVGYLFPNPQQVNLSNQTETGSWYNVNHQSDSPKEEVHENVFKLWLDHGDQVMDGSYEYIVVPSITESQMDKYNNEIVVLSNTPQIQAVKNTKLNISQLIYYTSGEIQIDDNLKIGIDSPGIVMLKTNGKVVKDISVADPTHKLGRVHLTLNTKIENSGDNFKVYWNDKKSVSEITIDLPQTVYAGKSVTIKF